MFFSVTLSLSISLSLSCTLLQSVTLVTSHLSFSSLLSSFLLSSPLFSSQIYELKYCGGFTCTNFTPSCPSGDEFLLLSCSKDESVRFWNTRNGTCLAIFAGDGGHRESVCSLDIHCLGTTFVSSGLDTSIKIWEFCDDAALRVLVEQSNVQGGAGFSVDGGTTRPFQTPHVQFPLFSTDKVHTDYVDCVRFCGDSIVSKSVTNLIIMWNPVLTVEGKKNGDVVALRQFVLTNCEVWFVRFNLDPSQRWMGAGNGWGSVKLWNTFGRRHDQVVTFKAPNCNSTVRMVSFSPGGDLIACCCDDGSTYLYNFDVDQVE